MLYFAFRCSILLSALFHFPLARFFFTFLYCYHTLLLFYLIGLFTDFTLPYFTSRCSRLLHVGLFYFHVALFYSVMSVLLSLLYFTVRCSISLHVALFCFPFDFMLFYLLLSSTLRCSILLSVNSFGFHCSILFSLLLYFHIALFYFR
jgi:hypothetical protein